MKRIDFLTKNEIIEVMANGCPAEDMKCPADDKGVKISCNDCKKAYLDEELEPMPRWLLIKSNEDLDRIFKDYYFDNGSLDLGNIIKWLKEEI